MIGAGHMWPIATTLRGSRRVPRVFVRSRRYYAPKTSLSSRPVPAQLRSATKQTHRGRSQDRKSPPPQSCAARQLLSCFIEPRWEPQQELCLNPGRPCRPSVWFGTVVLTSARWSGELVSINPFDDDIAGFFVLVTDEEQHSLWPAFADVPAGWRVVYGEADRAACLDHIEQNWPAILPKSLRERLGVVGEPDGVR
jgi:MbtH protein